MPHRDITKLSPEQEALIPLYQAKWRKIAFETKKIDKQKATEAIESAYLAVNRNRPQIFFFRSPFSALLRRGTQIIDQKIEATHMELEYEISSQVRNQLKDELCWSYPELTKEIITPLYDQLGKDIDNKLWKRFGDDYDTLLSCKIDDYFVPTYIADNACVLDFWITVLNCEIDSNKWSAFLNVVETCGWILLCEEICLVSDRPRKLLLDAHDRLHAIYEPAIQFADGYSLYAYHGVVLPEKYAKAHPNQWNSQWLTEEDDELRQALMEWKHEITLNE